MRLVLASTSPARRALLDQTGLPYEAESPDVEERLDPSAPAAAQARALALAKARAVAARHPDAIVVGADQVLVADGLALGKPPDEAAALAQLRRLAGRTHALVTGLAIVAPGRPPIVEDEETRITFRALDDSELAAYVATGEWRGCAGSYRLEGRGILLVERVEGDHTNVLGLPLPRLLGHLRALGVKLLAPPRG